MSPTLRLAWTSRARVIAAAFAVASVALAVWAAIDPRSGAWTVIAGAALALVCTLAAVETWVFRVDSTPEGLRRRSLRGSDTLAWSRVQGVRLVDTRHDGVAIVHTRTADLDAAFHVRLLTDRAGARPWDFHAWMDGFDDLLALVAEREWPRLVDPPAPNNPRVDRALKVLERANAVGTEIVAGFALLFALFVASMGIVIGAGVEPTRRLGLDLLIVAAALLAVAGLVDSLVRVLGARRLLSDGPLQTRRTVWMMNAAALIGGVLILVVFLPTALAGSSDAPWVDWVLVGMGAMAVVGGLRD